MSTYLEPYYVYVHECNLVAAWSILARMHSFLPDEICCCHAVVNSHNCPTGVSWSLDDIEIRSEFVSVGHLYGSDIVCSDVTIRLFQHRSYPDPIRSFGSRSNSYSDSALILTHVPFTVGWTTVGDVALLHSPRLP